MNNQHVTELTDSLALGYAVIWPALNQMTRVIHDLDNFAYSSEDPALIGLAKRFVDLYGKLAYGTSYLNRARKGANNLRKG